MAKINTAADFWARVDCSGACWIWQGRTARGGYGQFDFEGRAQYAHRLAYRFTYGECPAHLDVCHTCDNPRCVNPAHLWLGTHTDNMRDMFGKGRRTILRGEAHGVAKLTADQARAIRARYRAGGVTLRELAADYEVHLSLISLIVRNKIWRDA